MLNKSILVKRVMYILYLELQEKIWSIKPLINQMTIRELQDLVNFTFSIELEDEGFASKVFERATELYIQEYLV